MKISRVVPFNGCCLQALEGAEVAAEGGVRFAVELLGGKNYHRVLVTYRLQLGEGFDRHGPYIDIGDCRAEGGASRADVHL